LIIFSNLWSSNIIQIEEGKEEEKQEEEDY
jgi:hypothetical protein